jgi:hypothetical protein
MPHETIQPEVIAPPTLESNLDFWQERLDRLEAEAGAIAGTNQFPEWWNNEDSTRLRDVVPQLKDEANDPSNISRYYDLYSKQASLYSAISGREQYNHPMQQLFYDLGEDVLARGFKAESTSGSLHTALLEDIREHANDTHDVLTPELNVLRQAYGLETMTELLGIGGDDYNDELRKQLLSNNPIRWIRHNEEDRNPDFKWHDTQEAQRVWMSKAVEAVTGMPASEASDYVFSSSRKSQMLDERQDVLKILDVFNHFGLERVRNLAEFSGIHGIEAYSIEQLERMEKLASNPTEVAEQLSRHDVNVVMVNRFGDHNGVMKNVAADFDDTTGRTLFFEIADMSDVYRRMVTLRKAGVKPSTMVLAAHSAPGQFMVSDVREKDKALNRRDIAAVAGRALVKMVNEGGELDPGDYGYSMHGMKGMARLVEEYMQPSRGVDDDNDDIGRKKIIFQACHAASEVKSADRDESGEKVEIGMESVVSQLGKDLIASGLKTNVDIYGAPGGIQMHRNERGIHYSGQPTSFDEAMIGRPRMAAERIRVEQGKLSKQDVDEIVLRKAA